MVHRQVMAAIAGLLGFVGLVACGSDVPQSVMAGVLTRDGIGAHAIAVGGAYTATANDTTSGYYNPAGLADTVGINIGGMYERKISFAIGTSFQYVGATYGFENMPLGMGVTVVNRFDPDIPTEGGTFNASETLLLASVGYGLSGERGDSASRTISLGASLKAYLASGFDEARASGFGLDLAAQGSVEFKDWDVRFGYRSSDILGSHVAWSGTPHNIVEQVPWGQHLGLAARYPDWGLQAALDASLYFAEPDLDEVRFGVEWSFHGFSLRAGLRNGSPVFGVGIDAVDWLRIDVALALHAGLGQSLVASVELAL